MSEIKPITKFCISHRRTDASSSSYWSAYIWAENYMGAWDIAKELEEKIPLVYDITIEGVFLGELEAGINLDDYPLIESTLPSILPWFMYCQIDIIETNSEDIINYADMIKFFERHEEFEICGKLVKRKNSKKEIKL